MLTGRPRTRTPGVGDEELDQIARVGDPPSTGFVGVFAKLRSAGQGQAKVRSSREEAPPRSLTRVKREGLPLAMVTRTHLMPLSAGAHPTPKLGGQEK